jgi:hypothetical protein
LKEREGEGKRKRQAVIYVVSMPKNINSLFVSKVRATFTGTVREMSTTEL